MTRSSNCTILLLGLLAWVAVLGCEKRVLLVTSTTLGLNATPGDLKTSPPQVTFAYKRAEAATVPTAGKTSVADANDPQKGSDAFSTLATFHFESQWFGPTQLDSFIATGLASRNLVGSTGQSTVFSQAFATASLSTVPEDIQNRRKALMNQLSPLSDAQAQQVLSAANLSSVSGQSARDSLQDYIRRANDNATLTNLEKAFKGLHQ